MRRKDVPYQNRRPSQSVCTGSGIQSFLGAGCVESLGFDLDVFLDGLAAQIVLDCVGGFLAEDRVVFDNVGPEILTLATIKNRYGKDPLPELRNLWAKGLVKNCRTLNDLGFIYNG